MKTLTSDFAAVLKSASLIGVIVLANSVVTTTQARRLDMELLQSERLNAQYHAKSIDDREAIKKVQATNARRIAAVEAELAAVRAELAATRAKGDAR